MIALFKYDLFTLSSHYLTSILNMQWKVKGCKLFKRNLGKTSTMMMKFLHFSCCLPYRINEAAYNDRI